MKRISDAWKLVGDGLQLGASIVFAIFIGAALGYWLDGKLKTFPYLSIVFFLLGLGAAARNIMVELRKQLRSEKGDKR